MACHQLCILVFSFIYLCVCGRGWGECGGQRRIGRYGLTFHGIMIIACSCEKIFKNVIWYNLEWCSKDKSCPDCYFSSPNWHLYLHVIMLKALKITVQYTQWWYMLDNLVTTENPSIDITIPTCTHQFLQCPPAPLNVGTPLSALIPAPVNTTMCLALAKYSRKLSILELGWNTIVHIHVYTPV